MAACHIHHNIIDTPSFPLPSLRVRTINKCLGQVAMGYKIKSNARIALVEPYAQSLLSVDWYLVLGSFTLSAPSRPLALSPSCPLALSFLVRFLAPTQHILRTYYCPLLIHTNGQTYYAASAVGFPNSGARRLRCWENSTDEPTMPPTICSDCMLSHIIMFSFRLANKTVTMDSTALPLKTLFKQKFPLTINHFH